MHRPSPVPAAFIRAHTHVQRHTLVPEIALHVAADVVALWEAMQTERMQTERMQTERMQTERMDPAEEPPFWAAAWPGGLALARYVLDHPEIVAGRSVLDLGSGSGLVAIAAARAGARSVLASDPDPYSATAVGVNAQTNDVLPPTVVGDVLDAGPPEVDVILAGDVCYDRAMTERVLPFLGLAWLAGATVLLGDPGRPYLPREGLLAVACYEIEDSPTAPHTPVQVRSTRVWALP